MAETPEAGRETGKSGRFRDHASAEAAVVARATAQHSVLSLAQLVDLGTTPTAVHKRAAASRLHRIHSAVYSLVPESLLSRDGRWMAAVLACGDGAVLSHRSAAALHGLRATDRTNIDVTIPTRAPRKRRGIDVHRSRTLTEADTTVVNAIGCTTVARTLLELAEVVSHRALERAFDQAEILEVLNLRALQDQLERNRTRPGARSVRRVLAEHYIGKTPTVNELEEAFYGICRRTGIPLPVVNQWVDLGDGEPPIKADFLWRRQRVIVETDGGRFHGTQQARERDPRRDQRALLAGWRTVRTTWRQVMNRPHELEATLPALLGSAAA
jgi:hypothetical protein